MRDKFNFSEDFIRSSPLNVVFLDKEKRVVFLNNAASSNLEISDNEAKGLGISDFLDKFFEKAEETVNICRDGSRFPVLKRKRKLYKAHCFPIFINKEAVGFVLLFTDITKEEETRNKLKKETLLLNQVIEFIPDMLFVIDKSGKVIIWNAAAEQMTGVKKEEILGKGNYEYAIPFYGKRRPLLIDFALKGEMPSRNLYVSVKKQKDALVGFTNKPALKGEKKVLWGKASRFYDENGRLLGAIEIIRDVTEMKRMEHQLRRLAERDPLTGVFNRRQLMVLLRREIERCKRNNVPLTLFYIDVDNLKEINDTFGHFEGDSFLKILAKVFISGLRKIDIVARAGGDEFVIVNPSLREEDAEKLINRLQNRLKEEARGKKYKMEFSYGAFEFKPPSPISMENMLAVADERMYQMKKAKKRKG